MKKNLLKVVVSCSVIFVVVFALMAPAMAAGLGPFVDQREENLRPTWSEKDFDIGVNTGKTVIEYDVEVKEDFIDTVACFYDKDTVVTAWGNIPVLVRFDNASSTIQARNAGDYTADVKIEHSKGKKFHFKYVIDIDAKSYSVTVDDKELAKDYAFRTGADATDDISRFVLCSPGMFDKQVEVTNFVAYKFGTENPLNAKPAAAEPAPAATTTKAPAANPKTGDAGMVSLVLMGAASGLAVLGLSKKRKK